MTASASQFSVVDNTPRFTLDDSDRPDLTVRLQRLEVSHDDEGLRWLEAFFVHSGQRDGEEPGFLFTGEDAVGLGAQIKVAVGDEDTRTVIFEGRVSAVAGHFPNSEPALLRVSAEDRLMELRMQRLARAWETEGDQVIIDDLTRTAAIDSQPPSGETRPGYAAMNRAPLAVLRERARQLDRRLEWKDGELLFVERREASDPVALTWFDELLSFEACADLAHQRTEVRVHGYSRADKAGLTGIAGAQEIDPERRDGKTGPTILTDLGLTAVENTHLEFPHDQAEADEAARILAVRRARRFVVGKGVTRGTPELAVGSIVDVRGVDPAFGGEFDVVKVRHLFDRQQGLRTHFEAERADFPGEVAS